jgi:hypothetical protein
MMKGPLQPKVVKVEAVKSVTVRRWRKIGQKRAPEFGEEGQIVIGQ